MPSSPSPCAPTRWSAGLALSIFGSGLASFIGRSYVGQIGEKFTGVALPGLSQIPVLGPALFRQDYLVYALYILVPLASLYLYKTRPGLHLRTRGRKPRHRRRPGPKRGPHPLYLHCAGRHAGGPGRTRTCLWPTPPAGRRDSPPGAAGLPLPW